MCIVYFRFVQHQAFFAYRPAFSAIKRNIATLNLLHVKIFNYLVFRNVQNLYTRKFLRSYTVSQPNIVILNYYLSEMEFLVPSLRLLCPRMAQVH